MDMNYTKQKDRNVIFTRRNVTLLLSSFILCALKNLQNTYWVAYSGDTSVKSKNV